MLTICWAAKGGSGTTVFAAARALASPVPTLLIDLAGDAMSVLGLPEPDGPGVFDWLSSDSSPSRLAALELPAGARLSVLPAGRARSVTPDRWDELVRHLRADARPVIVDAGTRPPTTPLLLAGDERLLVTRACYLALRHAVADRATPTGVVLIEEPGRALRAADIEASLGAPIVNTVLLDPAIARAVDSGLLVSRLPSGWRRQLRAAA